MSTRQGRTELSPPFLGVGKGIPKNNNRPVVTECLRDVVLL